MTELLIRVEDIRETPRRFHISTDATWWGELDPAFEDPPATLRVPLEARLEAYRLGERLLFRGRVTGELGFDCSRCAETLGFALDEPLELLLEPARPGESVPEGGIALDAEDLELGRYAGDELNFAPVVLEILALAWPMQPLCREDCAGLCPRCGINRNAQRCDCSAEAANRPFADLARRLENARK